MIPENKKNIYWFIIDSVRHYKTGLDDRDRIGIFDELGKDAVEFQNCVTGAPSSLLSAGAMFTGLPATFVARHFNEWKFTGLDISSVSTLVDRFGYTSYPILDTRDLREILHNLLPPLRNRDLPSGYKLSDYVWHNRDISTIFKHLLQSRSPHKNYCYTLWYDCRRDLKTNDYVKEAIDAIKDIGDYDDSIIIMHSDHGYPDPRTKLNEEFFKNIGHDMILTDDNIKVPFILKYPGAPASKLVDNQVGLVDVIPTIFDLLDIPYTALNTSFQGKSVIPIISGIETESRVRKTDTRLPMDVKRIGSLRSHRFKYIYLYNDQKEFLYDLGKDPLELKNQASNKDYQLDVEKYRKLNTQYEEELFLFHDQQLKENLQTSITKILRKCKAKTPRIVIVSKSIDLLIKLLIDKLFECYQDPSIDLILVEGRTREFQRVNRVEYVQEISEESFKALEIRNVDLVLFMTENSSRVFLKKEHVDGIKEFRARTSFLINYNFELFNYFTSKWMNITYVKLYFDWDTKGYFYKQEPMYFIKDTLVFIRGVLTKAFNTLFRNQHDFDLKAARETIHYRKAILETNKSKDYNKMGQDELKKEIKQLQTREE